MGGMSERWGGGARKKRAGESQPSAVCRYIYQHELGGIQEAVQEKRERKRERWNV